MRDVNGNKLLAKGDVPIKTFLEAGEADVKVPLRYQEEAQNIVGFIKFETFTDVLLKMPEVKNREYPHLLMNCIACKDTHQGSSGGYYQCPYCVCYKCKGSGVNNRGGQCPQIKVAKDTE